MTIVVKDVKFGKYKILNVPHVELTHPNPAGEKLIREILVDIKLSDIYDHMKENKQYKMDFNDF
jgi:hypothetical protein